MPTEKNAAFLPRQEGFKLDRQRVKIRIHYNTLYNTINRKDNKITS
jgi:hypothetical protein